MPLTKLSENYQTTLAELLAQMREVLKPPPKMSVSQWADSERKLSAESSAEPGSWDTSRAEYQRGIMDAVSDPNIKTVVVQSASQIGKSEILVNMIGYHIAHDPAPILVLNPTVTMSQTFSKDRISPCLRDTPSLRGLVKDPRSRDSGNTTLHKVFRNGSLSFAGMNSPASLASRPIRILLVDELDRAPLSAGSEGDPLALAKKRTSTFWNKKNIIVSTPTVKGASRIEAEYEASDKRYYFVPCKACGTFQRLVWTNVIWEENKPESAYYECSNCEEHWTDIERVKAISLGKWEASKPTKLIAGFHLSGLYSPWVSLQEAVEDFIEAKKMPETLRVFVNTYFGETWEDVGETVDDYSLYGRREDYGEPLPNEILVITAGVDTQDDRLEIEILGHTADKQTFSIEFHVISGDPGGKQIWSDLDELLERTFETKDKRELGIRATCVDSGGHFTTTVYDYCRAREGRRIFAVKGVGGEGKPIAGRPTKNNLRKTKLFPIGTHATKELIFSRLKITEVGPGYCHFPLDYDQEYFKQLTAEKIVTRYHKGFPKRDFIKTRTRNEALDCRVYAIAALTILNVNFKALEKRSSKLVNNNEESFDKPKKKKRRPSRGQGFVNNW